MVASQREHLNFKPPAEGAPLLTTMSTCQTQGTLPSRTLDSPLLHEQLDYKRMDL